MTLREAVRTRRTVRRYDDREVPRDVVEELVRDCTHAPSACNRRGWVFVLVDDREDLDWLHDAGGSSVLKNARQALLVCYRDESDNLEWSDLEQSAAAAIAYFQLLAHERGIGSCWICHLPPKGEVAARFGVADGYEPVAMLTFGYYREGSPSSPRVLGSSVPLCAGRFAAQDGSQRGRVGGVGLAAKRLLRSVYYLLPHRSWLRGLAGRFEKKFDSEEEGEARQRGR